jgi:porin
VDVDLQKLIGADQLTFHANMFQIHGGGLSRGALQNLFVVSGIEALPSTRLYEAYFEKLWGNKRVSLKAGQLAADSEFFNTKYTDVLTNASMGWPAITSTDLPSAGPSPPLAAMGARILVNVTEQFSVLGGIFDGNQAGAGRSAVARSVRRKLPGQRSAPPLGPASIRLEQQEGGSQPHGADQARRLAALRLLCGSAIRIERGLAGRTYQQRGTSTAFGKYRRLGGLRAANLPRASQRRPGHRHIRQNIRRAGRP